MDIDVQFFVWTYSFISLGYTSRKGISRSYVNSMLNNLRNCQTVSYTNSQISHTVLHSDQQCMMVPISLCSRQHLLLFYFIYFYYSHPSRCEVVTPGSFALHFPDGY